MTLGHGRLPRARWSTRSASPTRTARRSRGARPTATTRCSRASPATPASDDGALKALWRILELSGGETALGAGAQAGAQRRHGGRASAASSRCATWSRTRASASASRFDFGLIPGPDATTRGLIFEAYAPGRRPAASPPAGATTACWRASTGTSPAWASRSPSTGCTRRSTRPAWCPRPRRPHRLRRRARGAGAGGGAAPRRLGRARRCPRTRRRAPPPRAAPQRRLVHAASWPTAASVSGGWRDDRRARWGPGEARPRLRGGPPPAELLDLSRPPACRPPRCAASAAGAAASRTTATWLLAPGADVLAACAAARSTPASSARTVLLEPRRGVAELLDLRGCRDGSCTRRRRRRRAAAAAGCASRRATRVLRAATSPPRARRPSRSPSTRRRWRRRSASPTASSSSRSRAGAGARRRACARGARGRRRLQRAPRGGRAARALLAATSSARSSTVCGPRWRTR